MVWDPFPSQLRPFWQRCFSVQVTLTNLSTSTITGLGRLWSSWMGASTSAVLSGNIKSCVVDSTPNSEKEPLLTDFARKKQPPIWPFPRWCWGLGWASSSIASGASSCAAETNHFFLSDFQSVAHLSITDCLGAHFARVQAGTFFVLHSAQHIFVLSSGLSYLPPQTASWTMKRQGERRLVARSLVREKHGILLMLAAARATELPGFFWWLRP